MFRCLNTTIRNTDIFGQPIRLQINGEENVRSILGGFMTICLIALVGATFVIYSKDSFSYMHERHIKLIDFNQNLQRNAKNQVSILSDDNKYILNFILP